MTKFKVGDVIRHSRGAVYTVVQIVEEEREVNANWCVDRNFIIKIKNAYVLEDINGSSWIGFGEEEEYYCIHSSCKKEYNNKSCPRCDKELIEKESFGLYGERYNIQKCNSCGWC